MYGKLYTTHRTSRSCAGTITSRAACIGLLLLAFVPLASHPPYSGSLLKHCGRQLEAWPVQKVRGRPQKDFMPCTRGRCARLGPHRASVVALHLPLSGAAGRARVAALLQRQFLPGARAPAGMLLHAHQHVRRISCSVSIGSVYWPGRGPVVGRPRPRPLPRPDRRTAGPTGCTGIISISEHLSSVEFTMNSSAQSATKSNVLSSASFRLYSLITASTRSVAASLLPSAQYLHTRQ